MIKVENVTLTYPSGKGVFDLNFVVGEGNVTGYLGPNGSGKTTTIRGLLGFMNPNEGKCSIDGFDSNKFAPKIQEFIGYIPGEISFIDSMDGYEFLDFMCDMRKMKDYKLRKELLNRFELNPQGKIRKFSKGMKQKLGIVTAFMHNPKVLILDEPTSGLDPLMQSRFIELINEEKQKGKTILMSSHIFEEVERTCDDVFIIKDGRIINKSDIKSLKSSQIKGFMVTTKDIEKAKNIYLNGNYEIKQVGENTLQVFVSGQEMDNFIKTTSKIRVDNFDTINQTIEEVFMKFYGEDILK